jgi:hypothetical protein
MSPGPAVQQAIWGKGASWDLAGRPGLQARRRAAAAVGRPEERPALPVWQVAMGEPAEREPAEREPAEREPAERELAEREPAELALAEREPAELEPAEREPVEREPGEREPAGREPGEREPVEWGAAPGRLALAARPPEGVSARVGKRALVRPALAGWPARVR